MQDDKYLIGSIQIQQFLLLVAFANGVVCL
jgi:hypothetical protein